MVAAELPLADPRSPAAQSVDESEVTYLIVHALLHGPFAHLGRALAAEAAQAGALPARYDFQGRRHGIGLDELSRRYAHVPPTLLQDGLRRLLAINSLRGPFPAAAGVRSALEPPPLDVLRAGPAPEPTEPWLFGGARGLPPDGRGNFDPLDLLRRESDGNGPAPRLPGGAGGLARRFWHVRCLRGHQSVVYCTACDSAATLAATGADDACVKLWDLVHGQLLASCSGHTGEITDLGLSCDDRLLASGSMDSQIRIWHAQGDELGQLVCVLAEHTQPISTIRWHPTRPDILLTGSFDGTARLWHIAPGGQARCAQVLTAHAADDPATEAHALRSERLAQARAARLSAVAAATQAARAGARAAAEAGRPRRGRRGRRGRRAARGARLGRESPPPPPNGRYPLRARSVMDSDESSSDDEEEEEDDVMAATTEAALQAAQGPDAGAPGSSNEYPPGAVLVAAFSPCGTRIALSTGGGALATWTERPLVAEADEAPGEAGGVKTESGDGAVDGVDCSVSGSVVASAASASTTQPASQPSSHPPIYDLLKRLDASHAGPIHLLQFSNDGARFATGSRDGWVRVWRFTERLRWRKLRRDVALVGEFGGAAAAVTQLSWACDDRALVVARDKAPLAVIIAPGLQGAAARVVTSPVLTEDAHVLECHPTEPELFMTACYNGEIALWSARDGCILKSFNSRDLRYTPPGSEQRSWSGPLPLTDGRFSPDGQTLLVADAGGQLYVFSLVDEGLDLRDPGEPVPATMGDVLPSRSLAAWRRRAALRRERRYALLTRQASQQTPVDQFLSTDFRSAEPEAVARRQAAAAELLGPERAARALICDAAGNLYPEGYQDAFLAGCLRDATLDLPPAEQAPGYVDVAPTVLAAAWSAQQRGASDDALRRAVRLAATQLASLLEEEERAREGDLATEHATAAGPATARLDAAVDLVESSADEREAPLWRSSSDDESQRTGRVDDGRRHSSRLARRREPADDQAAEAVAPLTREQQREERAARARRREEELETQLTARSRRSQRGARPRRFEDDAGPSASSSDDAEPGPSSRQQARRRAPASASYYDDQPLLPSSRFELAPDEDEHTTLPEVIARAPAPPPATTPRSAKAYAWLRCLRPTPAFYVPQVGDTVIYFRQLHRVFAEEVGEADSPSSRFPWDAAYADELCDAELCRVLKLVHCIDEETEHSICRLKLQFVPAPNEGPGPPPGYLGECFDVTIPHPAAGHPEFVILYAGFEDLVQRPLCAGETVYAFWREDAPLRRQALERMDEAALEALEPAGAWWRGRVLESRPLRSTLDERPGAPACPRGEAQMDTVLVLWETSVDEREPLAAEDAAPARRALRSRDAQGGSWYSAWELFRAADFRARPENRARAVPLDAQRFEGARWSTAALCEALEGAPAFGGPAWEAFQAAPPMTARFETREGEVVFYNRRVPVPLGLRDVVARLRAGYYRSAPALLFDINALYCNACRFNGTYSARGLEVDSSYWVIRAAQQLSTELEYLLRCGGVDWTLAGRFHEPKRLVLDQGPDPPTQRRRRLEQWWRVFERRQRPETWHDQPLQRFRFQALRGQGPLAAYYAGLDRRLAARRGHDWQQALQMMASSDDDEEGVGSGDQSDRGNEDSEAEGAVDWDSLPPTPTLGGEQRDLVPRGGAPGSRNARGRPRRGARAGDAPGAVSRRPVETATTRRAPTARQIATPTARQIATPAARRAPAARQPSSTGGRTLRLRIPVDYRFQQVAPAGDEEEEEEASDASVERHQTPVGRRSTRQRPSPSPPEPRSTRRRARDPSPDSDAEPEEDATASRHGRALRRARRG